MCISRVQNLNLAGEMQGNTMLRNPQAVSISCKHTKLSVPVCLCSSFQIEDVMMGKNTVKLLWPESYPFGCSMTRQVSWELSATLSSSGLSANRAPCVRKHLRICLEAPIHVVAKLPCICRIQTECLQLRSWVIFGSDVGKAFSRREGVQPAVFLHLPRKHVCA